MIEISTESANRLLALADFALNVANVTGNATVKMQAIEALAELFEAGRKAAKDRDAAQ